MTHDRPLRSPSPPVPPRSGLRGLLRRSFRARIFAVTTATTIAISAVFTLFFLSRHHTAEHAKLVTEGRLLTRLLAHNSRIALFAGNREQLREIAEGAMETPSVLTVTMFNRDGHALVHLARPGVPGDVSAATPPPTAEGGNRSQTGAVVAGERLEFTQTIYARAGDGSESALFYDESVRNGTNNLLGTVRVVVDQEPIQRQVRTMVATAACAAAAFLTLTSFVLYLIIRGITRPLTHLAGGVREIEEGKGDISIPVESEDEVGVLAASFNRMTAALQERRLEQEMAARQISELNIRLEEKVRERTAQLESVNRELESFNYAAAHDLRAPIARLNGLCQALGEDCGESLSDDCRDYLRRIGAVGRQMERVISAMSSLYQVQRREMSLRPLDLSAVVRAVVATLREAEPQRQVEVRVQPDVQVTGDTELLWLAMQNLVGNAWKFTARAAGAQIEFGIEEREGTTVCYLRDNGAGFDMAYAGKLFKPFQRLHGPDEFPGTGVGLAIVHRIISRHRGHIWLESAEEAGTTCYFTLPAAEGTTAGGTL